MPLKTGAENIRSNIKELMTGEISPSRRKAIKTLAKRKGMSFSDARFYQAKAIAVSQAKKKYGR